MPKKTMPQVLSFMTGVAVTVAVLAFLYETFVAAPTPAAPQRNNPRPRSQPPTAARNETPDDVCAICFTDTTRYDCTLPCLHRFHTRCISHWVQVKSTCPICRAPA